MGKKRWSWLKIHKRGSFGDVYLPDFSDLETKNQWVFLTQIIQSTSDIFENLNNFFNNINFHAVQQLTDHLKHRLHFFLVNF